MIVVLNENPDPQQRDNLLQWLKLQNVTVHVSEGQHQQVLGLV